jgi:prepilin-type N-terminal cleavage/methylation domain-containing protein
MAQRMPTQSRGFTLIELVVVMTIVVLLASIAAPRYFHSVELARENALRTTLKVIRSAIDQFAADKGRYPDSLQELASARYLREVPVDAITGERSSWVSIAPEANASLGGGMSDVASGARATSMDGSCFCDW